MRDSTLGSKKRARRYFRIDYTARIVSSGDVYRPNAVFVTGDYRTPEGAIRGLRRFMVKDARLTKGMLRFKSPSTCSQRETLRENSQSRRGNKVNVSYRLLGPATRKHESLAAVRVDRHAVCLPWIAYTATMLPTA